MSRNSYEKLTKAPSSAPNLKPELSSGTLLYSSLNSSFSIDPLDEDVTGIIEGKYVFRFVRGLAFF
jgi:hypothetical protein